MNCIPGQSQTWLLKAAINTNLAAGIQDLKKWQNATDFEAHIPRSEVLLIPMIWQKYKVHLAENSWNDRFGGLFKKCFYNNSRHFHHLGQILQVLNKGKYRYAIVNSIALNYYLYSDNGTRSLDQIDILIDPNNLISIIGELEQLDYRSRYEKMTPEMCLSGQHSAFILSHSTLKSISLHCLPAPFHNQKIANLDFLRDTKTVEFKGLAMNLLQPEKLFILILLNAPLSADWYWMADAVLLYRKYDLAIKSIRPFVSETHLFHTTSGILEFLWNEFQVGSSVELEFYQSQPLSLTDRYLIKSKSPTGLKFRIACIANFNGLNGNQNLGLRTFRKILIWYYMAFKRTKKNEIPAKTLHFLRDLLQLN